MLVIDSSDLTWDSSTRSFVAEASTLEARYQIRRLDYEAGKWLLRIRSHKTGTLAKFVREREEYSRDGELVAVHFLNEKHGCRLVILND